MLRLPRRGDCRRRSPASRAAHGGVLVDRLRVRRHHAGHNPAHPSIRHLAEPVALFFRGDHPDLCRLCGGREHHRAEGAEPQSGPEHCGCVCRVAFLGPGPVWLLGRSPRRGLGARNRADTSKAHRPLCRLRHPPIWEGPVLRGRGGGVRRFQPARDLRARSRRRSSEAYCTNTATLSPAQSCS